MTEVQEQSDAETVLLEDFENKMSYIVTIRDDHLKNIYQERLFKALKKNKIKKFNLLLLSKYIEIDQIVDNETCLTIAIKNGYLNFVNSILNAGADCNKIVNMLAPLHLAIIHRNIEIVERLLRESEIKVNNAKRMEDGILETPLIFLIREAGRANGENGEFFFKCAKELLLNEAEPNIKDRKRHTAIMIAIELNQKDIIRAIIDYSQTNVELDKYKFESGKTVREVINENYLYPSILLLPVDSTRSVNKLFMCLRRKETELFTEKLNEIQEHDIDFQNRYHALLRYSIRMLSERALIELLKRKDEIILFPPDNKRRLVDRACYQGNVRMLENLLDNLEVQPEILSAIAVKYIKSDCEQNMKIRECVDFLLKYKKMPMNEQDSEGNTILYYVNQRMDDDAVKLCLSNGASVAVKNKLNDYLLNNLNVNLFEEYLNSCISKINIRGNNVIEIDFTCLEPIKSNGLKYEMDLLQFMENNEDFKHLLTHPFFEAFIIMKSQRMNFMFYIYLIFYIIFCFVLFINSFISFYSANMNESVVLFFYILLLIYTLMLFIIEIPQVQYIPHYFKNVENILDILIIICCILILCYKSKSEYFAMINILAVLRLIFHLSKFRQCSTYVSIFKTVSLNFMKFISCSFILLLAFSWSFFITLRNDNAMNNNSNSSTDDTNVNFFNTWPGAFFKSYIMLTGEFSIEEINFTSYVGYVLLIMFIFIISIVFFNLLNGLAVSDIQMIKNDAELYGLISIMKEISFHEDMFLTWNEIISKFIRKVFLRKKFEHYLITKIDIFPDYLPDKKIYILPDYDSKIITQLDRPDIPCNISLPEKLIKKIIERTKKALKNEKQ